MAEQQQETTNDEVRLRAIAAGYKNSNGLVRWMQREQKRREEWVIKRMVEKGDLIGILDFHIEMGIQVAVKRPSVIKVYTNKGGKKHLAHFSPYDKYVGNVKKLGSKPVDCDFWVVPTRDRFTVDKQGVIKEIG
jgi:hypothetical protein